MTPLPGYSIQAGTYCLKLSMFGSLPNIFGVIDAESEGCGIAEGAFYRKQQTAIDNYPLQGSGNGDYIGLDASLCSNIYTDDGKIQTSALSVLCCIKI